MGPVFEGKCVVSWCTNKISAFDFEVGHNVPESLGGATELANLRPICSRCNKSMGNRYTIDAWNKMSSSPGTGAAVPDGPTVVPVTRSWLCC